MHLIGQRSFFELNVLDYEHPATTASVADRNLLWVAVRTGWQHHQSTSTAAILHTYELDALINWLRQLHSTGRSPGRLLFAEPCLGFECISADSEEYLLQIKLAFEIAPDWHEDPFLPFWLPIVVTKAKLVDAIRQLEDQFINFPVRR